MKLGIDGREIQDGVHTGIGRALHDLLCYFDAHAGDDTCVVFSAKPLPFAFSAKIVNRVLPQRMTWWWDQIQLSLSITAEGVDVFYSPYYKIPILAPCRKVASVLDLIYLEFPEYRRKLSLFRKLYYAIFGRACAHMAEKVLTCSQFSSRDIQRVYGLPAQRITVIPLGVGREFAPMADAAQIKNIRQSFGIPGRYILYTGNFKPHKNVTALADAFFDLAVEFGDITLVLAGPKQHGYEALHKKFQDAGFAGCVVFTGTVTDTSVGRLLYVGADIFVMPSLYEGFGLPPLEAMACGTAVVCSDAASLPEVVGDSAVMVNAADPRDIARGVRSLLVDDALRRSYVAKGLARAALFANDLVMPQMLACLRSAGR